MENIEESEDILIAKRLVFISLPILFNQPKKIEKAEIKKYTSILGNSLKFSNQIVKQVENFLESVNFLVEFSEKFDSAKKFESNEIIDICNWLRKSISFSKISILISQLILNRGFIEMDNSFSSSFSKKLENEIDVSSILSLSPLLDGHQISSLTNTSNKSLGDAIKDAFEWQLLHPYKPKHELENYLKQKYNK